MRVYLDHNATTPMAPTVRRVMQAALEGDGGNASSVHREGREARARVDAARMEVAALLGAEPRTVFFTSGATESNHLGIRGLALRADSGRRRIVTTQVEHPSVRGAVDQLESSGWEIIRIGVDADGSLDWNELDAALTPEVAVVSVMHANNETGVIFDVHAVAERAHAVGARVHVDAVQTVGRLPWTVEELGADAYSISAHKMRGPQGIGALQVRKGVPFEPIFPGGHQERGLRPGTENLLAIVGMGAAAKLAASERQDFADTVGPLRDSLGTMLRARVPDMRLNGRGDRLANTLNVAVPGCPGDALLQAMDLAGVAASSGSACTSGTVEPSHVLLAMGQVHEEAREAVRFTLARETTPHAMNRVVEVFCESVDRIRQADVLLEDWGKVG